MGIQTTKQFFMFIYLPFVILFTGVGCSTQKGIVGASETREELGRYSIVTVASRDLSVPNSSSYALRPDMVNIQADDTANILQAREVVVLSLNKGLQQRGYLQMKPAKPSDYWIGYTIASESELTDEEINRRYGLHPGFLTGNAGLYEKGTLIVDLIESKTRRVVWRSAAQGLVDPNLAAEIRRERLESAIAQMLEDLPNAE